MVALGSKASRARSEEEGILMKQKYGDDERRRAARPFSPALRVAAAAAVAGVTPPRRIAAG